LEHPRARTGALEEPPQQRALAEAGLAGEQDGRPGPSDRRRQMRFERSQLAVATDDLRAEDLSRARRRRGDRRDSRGLRLPALSAGQANEEDARRIGDALERDVAELLHREVGIA